MKDLKEVANDLARERGTSIVLLEIGRQGSAINCEDVSALQPSDGKLAVATAMTMALRIMVRCSEALVASIENPAPQAPINPDLLPFVLEIAKVDRSPRLVRVVDEDEEED